MKTQIYQNIRFCVRQLKQCLEGINKAIALNAYCRKGEKGLINKLSFLFKKHKEQISSRKERMRAEINEIENQTLVL